MNKLKAAFAILLCVLAITTSATAQVQRSTAVGAGQTIDINVHSDCKRVYYDGWGGNAAVTAPWDTPSEWQNFYNNPPPGVSISACPAACSGISQGGYCYYHDTSGSYVSCDSVCAGHGGCNLDGTRRIGNNDPTGANCSAYTSGIFGVSAAAINTYSPPYSNMGCFTGTYKGGWIAYDYYGDWTDCGSSASLFVRVCACNN